MSRGITQLPSYWYDEWARGQARIAELKAKVAQILEDHAFAMKAEVARAEQAEAEVEKLNHFCAKVCEPWQIVEETKAELLIAKRLNAKWMDERTEAIIRAERAEKALAGARLMPREKS